MQKDQHKCGENQRGTSAKAAHKAFLSSGPSALTRRRRCASPPSWRTAAISSTNRLAKSAFMSDQGIASTASDDTGRRRTAGSSETAGLPSPSRSKSSIAATRARTSGTATSTRLRAPHSPHSKVIQWSRTAPVAASSKVLRIPSSPSAAASARRGRTVAGSRELRAARPARRGGHRTQSRARQSGHTAGRL